LDRARTGGRHPLAREIQAQARQLKELVAELMIENRLLKKSVLGDGESDT
jgi:transposase